MSSELPKNFDAFYSTILGLSLNSLKFNTFTDNFDAERFNIDGVDHSRDFDLGSRNLYFTWFFFNRENLFNAYSLLADDSSRLLYLCLIVYRMVGHLAFKIPVEFLNRPQDLQALRNAEKSVESTYPVTGMFGNLRHFDFEFQGKHYVGDCLSLEFYLYRHQYFYNQNGIKIAPEEGDSVIDGGACLGDTALVFSNTVGPAGKVYSFDPVQEHCDVLNFNIKQFPYHNVEVMPYGLSDHEVNAPLMVMNHYAPGFSAGSQVLPLTSLDILVARGEIERIDFIKLDIEGAELEALKGAQESIKRFRPKMAVSLYHKPNDLYELMFYIKNNFDFYEFYLGHYTIHSEETVLYCKPITR